MPSKSRAKYGLAAHYRSYLGLHDFFHGVGAAAKLDFAAHCISGGSINIGQLNQYGMRVQPRNFCLICNPRASYSELMNESALQALSIKPGVRR
jgi:hypothetical protein